MNTPIDFYYNIAKRVYTESIDFIGLYVFMPIKYNPEGTT